MDKDQCRRLIELYASYRWLWDSLHSDYSNKHLRDDAWKDIGHKMSMPVSELKRKMDSLLGSYRREKSREKKSRIASSGRRSVYKSNWYAYKYFHFITDRYNARNVQNTMQDDGTQTQNIMSETENEGKEKQIPNGGDAVSEGRKRKVRNDMEAGCKMRERQQAQRKVSRKWQKKRFIEPEPEPEPTDERVPDAFEFLKQCVETPNDSCYTFGQHIANELRKYDPITLAHVKKAINNIIFEADTGRFQKCNIGYYTPLYASASGYSFAATSDTSHTSVSTPSPIRTASPMPRTSPIPTPASMPPPSSISTPAPIPTPLPIPTPAPMPSSLPTI